MARLTPSPTHIHPSPCTPKWSKWSNSVILFRMSRGAVEIDQSRRGGRTCTVPRGTGKNKISKKGRAWAPRHRHGHKFDREISRSLSRLFQRAPEAFPRPPRPLPKVLPKLTEQCKNYDLRPGWPRYPIFNKVLIGFHVMFDRFRAGTRPP